MDERPRQCMRVEVRANEQDDMKKDKLGMCYRPR